MAGIADMLIKGATDSAQGIGNDIKTGAQLAQTVEQISASRAAVEQKKQELQLQKVNSVVDTLKIASEAKDPKIKKFMTGKVLPGKVKALGLEDFFTPESMELLQTSDDAMKKVLGLQLDLDGKIRRGEITGAEAYQIAQGILNNPEELAMLQTDQLFEAQKFQASEEGKGYRSKLLADSRMGAREDQQNFQAGQQSKQNAEAYAKKIADMGIPNLKVVFSDLEKRIPGGFEKFDGKTELPGIGGADALIPASKLSDPEARKNRQLAQSLANQVLKLRSGAAVTDGEATRLLNEIGFEAAIGEGGGWTAGWKGIKKSSDFINGANNIRRQLNETDNTLKSGAGIDAIQYYEKNKKFFEGESKAEAPADGKQKQDFKSYVASKKDSVAKLSSEEQAKAIKKLADHFGKTPEEVKKELGL